MKNKIYLNLILGCSLGLSSISFAAHHEGKELPAGHPPVGMFEKMDADKNGLVNKTEFDSHHTMMFEKIDTNKDGSLSSEEAKMHHDTMKSEMHNKMKDHKNSMSSPAPM
ncbi:MAG: hypothetical protein V4629_01315 [Pseudomonadota bacterium]